MGSGAKCEFTELADLGGFCAGSYFPPNAGVEKFTRCSLIHLGLRRLGFLVT